MIQVVAPTPNGKAAPLSPPPPVNRDFIADNVPVEKVTVDYSYARPLTAARMAKLDKTSWNARRAGVLYMSMRNDGTYYTIDGQGRMYLALKANVKTVPARVYLDLTLKEEAELYLAFNRDRAPTKPIDDFKAKLTAHDQSALSIQAVLNSLGLKLMRGGGTGSVDAVGTIEEIHATWGPHVLEAAFKLLIDTWHMEPASLAAYFIGGATQFVVRYPHLTPKQYVELSRALDKERLPNIIARARSIQLESPGMTMASAVGRVFWAIYNRNHARAHTKLPEWQTRVATPATKAAYPARVEAMTIANKSRRGKAKPAAAPTTA